MPNERCCILALGFRASGRTVRLRALSLRGDAVAWANFLPSTRTKPYPRIRHLRKLRNERAISVELLYLSHSEKADIAVSAAQRRPYTKKEPRFLWGSDLLAGVAVCSEPLSGVFSR